MVELEEAINWEIRKGKERNLIGDVNGGSGWHGRALSLAVQCRDSAVLQVLKASFDCTMDSELFNCWPPPNTIHTNTPRESSTFPKCMICCFSSLFSHLHCCFNFTSTQPSLLLWWMKVVVIELN